MFPINVKHVIPPNRSVQFQSCGEEPPDPSGSAPLTPVHDVLYWESDLDEGKGRRPLIKFRHIIKPKTDFPPKNLCQ